MPCGPSAFIILINGPRCRSAREVPGSCWRGPDSKDATLNLEVASKRALLFTYLSVRLRQADFLLSAAPGQQA